jgi:hypothetical protein
MLPDFRSKIPGIHFQDQKYSNENIKNILRNNEKMVQNIQLMHNKK